MTSPCVRRATMPAMIAADNSAEIRLLECCFLLDEGGGQRHGRGDCPVCSFGLRVRFGLLPRANRRLGSPRPICWRRLPPLTTRPRATISRAASRTSSSVTVAGAAMATTYLI